MPLSIEQRLISILPAIKQLRQQLHASPELSFRETETVKIIKSALLSFGVEVVSNVGKTGLVAVLDTGRPGHIIGFRADFDALSISEKNTFQYKSTNEGVMHACGHDGHTAILVCLAGLLTSIKESLSGKMIFIFQPAEESGEGAKAMLKDGILKKYPMDAIYALHNFPKFPAGRVATKSHCILAGMDAFEVTVRGNGGHASIPERCVNPITVASIFQEIVGKSIGSVDIDDSMCSINFTEIRSLSGESINVIPDSLILKGITRFSSEVSQSSLRHVLTDAAATVSQNNDSVINITYHHSCPISVNAPDPTRKLIDAVQYAQGEDSITVLENPLAAFDDFAYFLDAVPGCYFLIGNGVDSEMVHTANYDFNDDIILPAVNVLAHVVLSYQP